MVTLDLLRVDRKAQGPRPIGVSVLYVLFWSHSKSHTKAQSERPKGLIR